LVGLGGSGSNHDVGGHFIICILFFIFLLKLALMREFFGSVTY
jgi:hypothetical protein